MPTGKCGIAWAGSEMNEDLSAAIIMLCYTLELALELWICTKSRKICPLSSAFLKQLERGRQLNEGNVQQKVRKICSCHRALISLCNLEKMCCKSLKIVHLTLIWCSDMVEIRISNIFIMNMF